MAGLALVLPKNIWNYVVQESNIARFGKRFVLQGGTQKNLAAVKAQVDYIRSKIPDASVFVHKYSDICGAIGAAMEAVESVNENSSFIGIENGAKIEFTTTNNESTRCRICANRCPRAFIDIARPDGANIRFISGYQCEKGMADSVEEMKEFAKTRADALKKTPNLVDMAAHLVFSDFEFEPIPRNGADVDQSSYYPENELNPKNGLKFAGSSTEVLEKRKKMGCIFLAPIAGMVPAAATAPALIAVGIMMMSAFREIKWDDLDEAIPAFFAGIFMALAYSISYGIAAGFIFYIIVKVTKREAKDIHPILWVSALLFVLNFILLAFL